MTRADISGIDPGKIVCERDSSGLKAKFSKLKSIYGTLMLRYEESGQGDSDRFSYFSQDKSYIIYTHGYVTKFPILRAMTTRSVSIESQKEKVLYSDIDNDTINSQRRQSTGGRIMSTN